MRENKQNLFGKEYFEGGKNSNFKKGYNWDSAYFHLRPIANSLNKTIKPRTALDIGCAKGYLVYLLNSIGINSYGVDVSNYAVSQARAEIKEKLYVLDIEEDTFPFPEARFDLIILLEVLEHLNNFDHLLNEITRLLSKDGYVVISTPPPHGRGAKNDKTHINLHPKKFWVELFNRCGLILVKDDVWRYFKKTFLEELIKIMPENPPSTKISLILTKMGWCGNFIRNNVFPYIDYFSPLRSGEILLFRKIERGNESGN